MSSSNSYSNRRRLNLQSDIPQEIKQNILQEFESPRDVKNLGKTSVSFNVEAKRLQFRVLDLDRLLDYPNELGEMRNIDGLIEQLSTTAVREAYPLSFYVREVKYMGPRNRRLISGTQLRAILSACDQLRVIHIKIPLVHEDRLSIDWPGILRTKNRLQRLYLSQPSHLEQRHSFWSLLSALTTTSPNIESIVLKPWSLWYDEEHGHIVNISAVVNAARVQRPCRKLETVIIEAEVWTIPYLKYLTIMAPNLAYVHLHLKYETNLNPLKSTLEESLRAWSGTLRELQVRTHQSPGYRQLLPVTFPEMMKLEKLVLIGVQISGTSLYNLESLKSLSLYEIGHQDIAATLSRRYVLKKLTELNVDRPDIYRDIIVRRNLNYK